jgi:hypothetical protein
MEMAALSPSRGPGAELVQFSSVQLVSPDGNGSLEPQQNSVLHITCFSSPGCFAFQKKGGNKNKRNKAPMQGVAQGRCETGEVDQGELN